MANYIDEIYAEVDKQFAQLSGGKDFFSDKPLVDPTPYETGFPIQPVGWVVNASSADGSATVVIDANGITITDGALTIIDDFGNTVLTGAGFGSSWKDFIASGFYNSHFEVGTTSPITAATIIGTASTEADYIASLSVDLPYWIVTSESGAGTFERIADATAVGGFAAKWSGTETAEIAQDIPIIPGSRYQVFTSWRYTNSASQFTKTLGYQFRKSDHSAIGSVTESSTAFTTSQAAYGVLGHILSTAAPSDARYMRVLWKVARDSGSPSVWVNSFFVSPLDHYGSLQIIDGDFRIFDQGDVYPSIQFDVTASIPSLKFGAGTNPLDVSIDRGAPGTLTTGGDFNVDGILSAVEGFVNDGTMHFGGDDESSVNVNTNNWAPPTTPAYIRLTGATATRIITGMVAGTNGEVRIIQNNADFSYLFTHADASSTLGNRWNCPDGSTFVLRNKGAVIVVYNSLVARWNIVEADNTPKGIIVLWWGETTTIPAGWYLCDGTNGTPDLRDRFIIGASTANENTSGGTVSASAALATHATHAGHSDHTMSGTTAGNTAGAQAGSAGSFNINSHSHGVGTLATSAHSAHGAHDAHAIMNYYRLAYIMRS